MMKTEQLKEQINKYLADKELAWAPTTLKSERHRLNAALPHLDGKPETLWRALSNHGAYGRTTIWTRVCDFWQWMQDHGLVKTNPYRTFRKKNARQFKYVYEPKKPDISWEEAKARIQTIPNLAIRRRALEILGSGLRVSESNRPRPGQVVRGKGNRPRAVFVPQVEGPDFSGNYQAIRRALAKVGLKPHDLRKLFLSRLVAMGANPFELAELAGWSDIKTAESYIKNSSERMKRLVEQVHGGTRDESSEE